MTVLGRKQGGIYKVISKKDNGYYNVVLSKNGKNRTFHIHKIVAFMFVKNDNNELKTEINHKDEDKSNNKASNLEWVSHIDNMEYGTRKDRHREQVSNENGAWSRKVKCITTGEIFECVKDGAEKYNLFPQNVGQACKKRGFSGTLDDGTKLQWMYLEDKKHEYFENFYGVNIETNEIIFFKNSKQAKDMNFEIRAISKCLRGKQKTHKNYKFVKELDKNEL